MQRACSICIAETQQCLPLCRHANGDIGEVASLRAEGVVSAEKRLYLVESERLESARLCATQP